MKCSFSTPSADNMGDPRCETCGKLLPDCFEIEAWVCENQPELYEALRYTRQSERLRSFDEVWINKTCPRKCIDNINE